MCISVVYTDTNVIDIAKQLQSEIKQTLKNTLDLDHVKVDVHIEGIIKE